MVGRTVVQKLSRVRERTRPDRLSASSDEAARSPRGGRAAAASGAPSPVPSPLRARGDFISASDYAYATIRQEIVEGRFAPGRRMREIALAGWLGISRTPLRHALSRLEVEGLLTLVGRAGLVVASLDDQAVFELYETREALEGTAAALAARHATESDLAQLERLAEFKSGAVDDPAALYRHNRTFHEAIYAAAHNRFLLKSLQALHDALALLGPTTLTATGRPTQAEHEHAHIVAAIMDRDATRAEAEARAHIRNGFPLRRAMRAGRSRA